MNITISKIIKVALPRFAFAAAMISVSACGPGVRTTDGDCYYPGKGLLQIGSTLLDSAAAYAEATAELAYQKDQVDLQHLSAKLDSIDVGALDRQQNYAYAINDVEAMAQIDAAISDYNSSVEEEEMLRNRIRDYQNRKETTLKEGSDTSFSQLVAESGDCPD